MSMTMDALAAEIRQRIDGLETSVNETVEQHVRSAISDNEIQRIIRESLPNLLDDLSNSPDAEVQRKVRGWGSRRDPKLAGSKYGRMGMTVSDVEMLHDITSAAYRSRLGPGPSEELTRAFEACSTGRYEDAGLVRSRDEQRLSEMFESRQLTREGYAQAVRALESTYARSEYRPVFGKEGLVRSMDKDSFARAMDTQESGFGQQLIGAQYVHELWRGAQAQARVAGLIRRFDMTDPTAYLPVQANLPVVKYVGESTVANAASYASTKTGSNRVQVDARRLVMLQVFSYELAEDSIVPLLPFLREEAERSWAHHMDSIVINGDMTNAGTGNINSDDADPDDDAYYLAFDGLRHAALVDNTNNVANLAGPITITALRQQRARMVDATYKHDWSHPSEPDELVYLADPGTADAISFLDEFITLDKFGPNATVLTGQQGKILGHPLIPSIDVPTTEADGKVSATAANNTKGQLVTFNRRGVVLGTRSMMNLEVDREPRTQQQFLVWSTRIGLGRYTPTGAASGIEWVDVLRNVEL